MIGYHHRQLWMSLESSNIDFSSMGGLPAWSYLPSLKNSGTNEEVPFIQLMTTMIAESATYWHRFDEFYSVFYAFASASREQCYLPRFS